MSHGISCEYWGFVWEKFVDYNVIDIFKQVCFIYGEGLILNLNHLHAHLFFFVQKQQNFKCCLLHILFGALEFVVRLGQF